MCLYSSWSAWMAWQGTHLHDPCYDGKRSCVAASLWPFMHVISIWLCCTWPSCGSRKEIILGFLVCSRQRISAHRLFMNIDNHSVQVSGWLQKWLNLITALDSVSNEPGSVTCLATKYLKTARWRNHTEKLTSLWLQNIPLVPKVNTPSSYFTILMLNCLENTLKLQLDSNVSAVKFLT